MKTSLFFLNKKSLILGAASIVRLEKDAKIAEKRGQKPPNTPKNSPPLLKNEKGVALLMTLLVVTLLVTLILGLDSTVRRDLRMVNNLRDDLKATYIAKSGVAAARALLKDDSKRSSGYDAYDEVWATPFPPYPLGDGLITAEIQDESGKFNVNTVVNASGIKDEERVKILVRLFDLSGISPEEGEEIVESIVDWIDPDDETLFGAEDGHYTNLEKSYQTKNGYITHLSELHQIKGITDKVYNKVSPYLTVYPIPKNNMSTKINVNTAESAVIQSFSPDIDSEKAEQIMENRPFDSERDFKEDMEAIIGQNLFLGINKEGGKSGVGFKDVFGIESNLFSVKSQGIVNELQKTVRAVIHRHGSPEILYWRVE